VYIFIRLLNSTNIIDNMYIYLGLVSLQSNLTTTTLSKEGIIDHHNSILSLFGLAMEGEGSSLTVLDVSFVFVLFLFCVLCTQCYLSRLSILDYIFGPF
jgi:hypothetical protein